MISRKLIVVILPALIATSVHCNAQPSEPDNVAKCDIQPKHKEKGRGLRGLLSAAKRAGVGNVLGSGLLGNGRAAQVADTLVDAAAAAGESGDTSTAVADLAGSVRTAQAASVAAETAIRLARQASAECGKAE